jgi:5-methyltetrahydropteroyltriglutamate--homocysteine methyltransferase
LSYPLQRWGGLLGDHFKISPELPPYPAGHILNEVVGGMRWPRVVGPVEPSETAPLEYAKIWRLSQARAAKPVKFGTVCIQSLSLFLDVVGGYDQDDQRTLIWDLASAMNAELRELAAAGCKVIQVEEPALHAVACFHPENTDLIDFLVDAFNHEVAGLEDVEVWVHTCWGNPNMQKGVLDGSYANSVEIFLERLNADVWTIEAKDSDFEELRHFAPYTSSISKKIAIGVVSHRTLQVETPEEVAAGVRKAMEYIPVENLILSSDCGFGRQGSNRMIAFYKAVSIAQGANILRRELGLEERYVPAADPTLQVEATHEDAKSPLLGRYA